MCKYLYTDPETQVNTLVNVQATCGYNDDEFYYCRRYRSKSEFQMYFESKTWADVFKGLKSCHVASTIQYCKTLYTLPKSDQLRLQAAKLMMFLYTTTGTNWALVANNDYSIKKSITNDYWRLIEGAFSTFSIAAVALLVTALNLI